MFASAQRRQAPWPKMQPVSRDTAQMRMLRRALENSASEPALAKALGVPAETLSAWLAGESIPPEAYFRTIALVGSKARDKKPPRYPWTKPII